MGNIFSPYETLSVNVQGKSVPPSNVTGFQMVVQGSKAFFSWDSVSDLDIQYYWLRYSSDTVNGNWGKSITISDKIPGNSTTYLGPLSDGIYFLKAVDTSGVESETATAIISDFADILALNALQTIDETTNNFGNSTSDAGVNDTNSYNIYYNPYSDVIQLAGNCLAHGTNNRFFNTYNNTVSYSVGVVVDDGSGNLYQCTSATTGNTPPTNASYWSSYTDYILRDLTASFDDIDSVVGIEGYTVRNLTDGTTTTIASGGVTANILTLNADIFADGDDYQIVGYYATGNHVDNGTTDILRDTSASFDSSFENLAVRNVDTGEVALVLSVDSSGEILNLSDDIFDSNNHEYRVEYHVAPLGYYYFQHDIGSGSADYFDLGAVYTSRCKANLAAESYEVGNYFDGAQGLFDAKSGKFDGGDISSTDAQLEVSVTDDDPSGTPTWLNYQKFFIGDYHARAFRFRVKFTSSDDSQNIQLSGLSAEIDMPDTVKREYNVLAVSGTKAVTFTGSAFKQTEPVVSITLLGAATGDYFTISSLSGSGFTINIYDSSDTAKQLYFNYIAVGY